MCRERRQTLWQSYIRRGSGVDGSSFRSAFVMRSSCAAMGQCSQGPSIRAYQAETGTPADDDARVRHVALGPLGLGSLAQPAHARLFFCSQLQPNTTLMACWGLVSAEPPRL